MGGWGMLLHHTITQKNTNIINILYTVIFPDMMRYCTLSFLNHARITAWMKYKLSFSAPIFLTTIPSSHFAPPSPHSPTTLNTHCTHFVYLYIVLAIPYFITLIYQWWFGLQCKYRAMHVFHTVDGQPICLYPFNAFSCLVSIHSKIK